MGQLILQLQIFYGFLSLIFPLLQGFALLRGSLFQDILLFSLYESIPSLKGYTHCVGDESVSVRDKREHVGKFPSPIIKFSSPSRKFPSPVGKFSSPVFHLPLTFLQLSKIELV